MHLKEKGIDPEVYTFPTVKPIDRKVILDCAEKFDLIATVEEHNIVGGFGSAVAEVMAEKPQNAKLLKIGLEDTYSSKVGSQKYLRGEFHIDAKGIANKILEKI